MNEGTQDVLRKILSGEPLTPAGEVVAREMSMSLGFHKEANGDMMIAWYPPMEIASRLAIENGEEVDDLHVTIVFIPANAQANPEVVRAVTLLCCQWEEKLVGNISGTGRFVLDGDTDAFFVTVDVPGLERLRAKLLCELEKVGIWIEQKHGFTPHITLRYMPRNEPSPGQLLEAVPIEITTLTHAERGGLRCTYDLWDWEKDQAGDAAASVNEIAMTKQRPEDPEAGERFDRTVKAGMDACTDCGAPMLEKDGDKTCSKCAKAATTKGIVPVEGPDLTYVALPHPDAVVKGEDGAEWQYTLGPLYAPGVVDAHGEYADDEDLHAAVLRYSLKNDRRLKLQHDTSREVGTWVELMRWPYDHTVTLTRPGEKPRTMDLPAGTIYMGILWDDDAWAAVKDGTLGGLSLGGRAVRVTDGAEGSKA